nr:hypothetical protein [Tanacetum cinerariifolium]
ESSEEVGVLQNVHRNLVDWIDLQFFHIKVAVSFSYWHPSDVRQDLIINTSRWCHYSTKLEISKNGFFIGQVKRRVRFWVELVLPLKVIDDQLGKMDTRDHNKSCLLFPVSMMCQIPFVFNKCMDGLGKFFPDPLSIINMGSSDAYLAKVAKHERYLAGETGSDPDSPVPKPIKTAKKPKPTTSKADPRPQVSKPALTKQPEPKSAPAKTQGKKRKLTTEISNKPSKAKTSRQGLVSKRRKPVSSLRSVDESVAEYVPAKEPRVDDEEADV